MPERYTLRIKDIPASDRPRERLLAQGARALSDAELLALILRTGTGKESAVGLAQRILGETGGPARLAALEPAQLAAAFDGIGPAKAAEIAAMFELGRRAGAADAPEAPAVDTSRKAYDCLRPKLTHHQQEEFWIVMVNSRGRHLGEKRITRGGGNHTVIEPSDVFRAAVAGGAAGVILAHNHPNGHAEPSEDDVALTERLVRAGAAVGIQVMDHLVITDTGYYSFMDSGIMPASG